MAEFSVPRFNFNAPLVDDKVFATQQCRTFLNSVHRFLPIVGEGSPEGVVIAPQYASYIDSNAGAGDVEYRKLLAEIGGDTTQGWVKV